MINEKYIRFDWAVKRMLRDKANFDVLEGLINVLLGEKITIEEILESEGNQDAVDDKFNRVDIKARDANGSHRQESKVHGAKNRREHENYRAF